MTMQLITDDDMITTPSICVAKCERAHKTEIFLKVINQLGKTSEKGWRYFDSDNRRKTKQIH